MVTYNCLVLQQPKLSTLPTCWPQLGNYGLAYEKVLTSLLWPFSKYFDYQSLNALAKLVLQLYKWCCIFANWFNYFNFEYILFVLYSS